MMYKISSHGSLKFYRY